MKTHTEIKKKIKIDYQNKLWSEKKWISIAENKCKSYGITVSIIYCINQK